MESGFDWCKKRRHIRLELSPCFTGFSLKRDINPLTELILIIICQYILEFCWKYLLNCLWFPFHNGDSALFSYFSHCYKRPAWYCEMWAQEAESDTPKWLCGRDSAAHSKRTWEQLTLSLFISVWRATHFTVPGCFSAFWVGSEAKWFASDF